MSEIEKEEVCELFNEWLQRLEAQSAATNTLNATDDIEDDDENENKYECVSKVQTVGFKAFHGWFYDLMMTIHNTMSDRLINYILSSSLSSNTVDTSSLTAERDRDRGLRSSKSS